MKTDIGEYLEFIEFISKNNRDDKFLLEIAPVKGIKKSIAFYSIIEYKNPKFNDLFRHFRFISKNLDNEALTKIEEGLVNLVERGYKINYYNTADIRR